MCKKTVNPVRSSPAGPWRPRHCPAPAVWHPRGTGGLDASVRARERVARSLHVTPTPNSRPGGRRMAGGPPGLGVDVSLPHCASKPTVPTVACASKRTPVTVPTVTCQTIQCLHPRTATLDLFQFMPISCLPKALSYTPGPLLVCASFAVEGKSQGLGLTMSHGLGLTSALCSIDVSSASNFLELTLN